jgi:hypothetical protein
VASIDKQIAVVLKAIVHVDSRSIGGRNVCRECVLLRWTGIALLSGFPTQTKIMLDNGCSR